MKKFSINIQSFSDIITNSSSEIFALKSNCSFESVKSLIKEIAKENEESGKDKCSGEGGLLAFYTWEDMFKNWKEDNIYPEKQHLITPEIWSIFYKESLDTLKKTIWVDIDYARKETINFILNTFYVYNVSDGLFEKDPKTGRILKSVDYEEYKKLPEERQYGYY